MVIATQNPIEMEGTYALPEAQRDRFMARVSVGYPVEAAEIAMLDSHTTGNPLDDLEPVTDAAEIRKLIAIVGQVYVSEAVQRYAVALTAATRRSEELTLGASPRATLHLVRAAKAMAAMHGRDYVLPDDVHTLARPVLAHRLLPSVEAADERPLDHGHPRRRRASPASAVARGGPVREALVRSDRPRTGVPRRRRDGDRLRDPPRATRADPGRRAGPRAAAGHRRGDRPQPLPARAGPHRVPAAGRGRPAGRSS